MVFRKAEVQQYLCNSCDSADDVLIDTLLALCEYVDNNGELELDDLKVKITLE